MNVSGTTSADDEDLLTESANSILNLVLWSSSLLLQDTSSQGSPMIRSTPRNQGRRVSQSKNARKTRRPKHTTLFPPDHVRQGFPTPVIDGFAPNPRRSMWYDVYVMHPQVDNARFQALFRRRFRLPYKSFVSLNSELEHCPLFSRWHSGKCNVTGLPSSPLPLLLLSVLRYLGRSWTIDDLAEATCISEEVIRSFIHRFLHFGSTVLYPRLVVSPSTYGESKTHIKEY
jgi:hypothetical protein